MGTGGYIDGIFDYCDRWCERCGYTDRCRLADHERIRNAAHRAAGEDPDSWETGLRDVEDSFRDTISMIREEAERLGIDLDLDVAESEEQVATQLDEAKKHPLYVLAMKFTASAGELLDEHGAPILQELERGPSGEKSAELKDSLEVLSWYHTMIPAKLFRAVGNEVGCEPGAEQSEFERLDSDGSAKVAHTGLLRTLKALQVIQECRPWLRDPTIRLMLLAGDLIEGVDREFPGHRGFRCPGGEG